MNWTQEQCEKFWTACGAEWKTTGPSCECFMLPGDVIVGTREHVAHDGFTPLEEPSIHYETPEQCDLKTLLDILKRLAKEKGYTSVALVSFVQADWEHTQMICAHPQESVNVVKDGEGQALIAAICVLLNIETPEGE